MTPRSILIIDDDEQLRSLFRKVLEEAGYLVFEAPNGQEGLRQFRQTPTALVITDLFMPDMDGFEVTRVLYRESPSTKVIVLTGGSGENMFAATFLGARRTMKKPISMAELLQAVEQELQKGSPRKGHGQEE
ncbi:MAG TPA: response regulator [Nitrospiraceae bacterium]|nr:response regulator [Nitrospiraceae bacterium]